MKFVSTRNKHDSIPFSQAILDCLPQDGGLYVPMSEENLSPWIMYMDENTTFNSIAGSLTSALIKEEFSPIISEAIATKAFPFSPVFKQLDSNLYVLELFHTPTGTHKDFGVSYLASCLEHILLMQNKTATVMAVTNGETGACIVNAFRNKKRLKAVLLYTKGTMRGIKDSDYIENGGNILPVEVNGTQEDCLKIAREIYSDKELIHEHNLTLANTVNIGRLLPQIFFYMYAFSKLRKNVHGEIYYSLSAGNYGNLVAGLYGWKFSLPVNGFITDCSSSLTLDSSNKCMVMDSMVPLDKRNPSDPINPSNIERLEEVFITNPAVIKGLVYPALIPEAQKEQGVKDIYKKYGYITDIPTASAYQAMLKREDIVQSPEGSVVLIARDHPSLMNERIKHLCGETPPLPDSLKEFYTKTKPKILITPDKKSILNLLAQLK